VAVNPGVLAQRTGASLFGMLKIDDEEQRMSFKMSCTYCHQVGTGGFRTPEQPVDWLFCYTYNALVPHAKLMKSTEALWTKVLPKFM
jgi:hypothetical protein